MKEQLFLKSIFSTITKIIATLIVMVVLPLGLLEAGEVGDDDPSFVSVGVGSYDFNRKKEKGTEIRLEYRSKEKFIVFKPFTAAALTTTSQGFIGAGVLVDLYFGRRFVATPSFAPHYYWGGNKKLDLGHKIEFRSQLELSYRLDNRSRIGLALSHYSNASLGDTNPGTETATVYFSIPIK